MTFRVSTAEERPNLWKLANDSLNDEWPVYMQHSPAAKLLTMDSDALAAWRSHSRGGATVNGDYRNGG